MNVTDATGPVKAPTACYEEPTNVSAKADYYLEIDNKMKLDSHYSGIVTKIDASIVKVDDFKSAILAALSGTKGKVSARNDAEVIMKSAQNFLLASVQEVCDADPVNAKTHLESLGLSWYQREIYTRDDIEIRHGKISGSFDLLVKRPKGLFAVVWFMTTTPDDEKSWGLADFSHTAHGFIAGLEVAQIYYFKAKSSSSVDGKSDWTQIIKMVCN